MQERLLHFIWQNKLFNAKQLKTHDGSHLEILHFGQYNKDGGPDFLNAKIRVDDIILVGNIELHIHASDWKLHKHQRDKKYDTVILHVVYFNNEKESAIPVLELNGRIPVILLEKYETMMQSKQELICRHMSHEVDDFIIEKWKERLMIERLERKSNEILRQLQRNNNDWEQTCYQLLGKYFGSYINKEPFEMLTRSLDYKILARHSDNTMLIEAMLLGVAGLLDKDFIEIYPRALKQEYHFLRQKYNLPQMQGHQWQFMRMRPVSFPTIRIALFAQLMQYQPLLQMILEHQYMNILDNINASGYWSYHYVLDKRSKPRLKAAGSDFKRMLQINVFAPVIYAYGKYNNEEKYIDKALTLLYDLPKEENAKIRIYHEAGWKHDNAFDTQALIELHDNYCVVKKCLECTIGHKILKTSNSIQLTNNH